MPDVPEPAVESAAAALCELHHLDPEWARTLARAALEAAAPVLAEAWKPKRAPRAPKREVLARCQWCFKHNRTASEYEQENLEGVWHRLCVRCANVRLRNPYNALLPMRKIGSEEKESEHS